MLAEYSRNLKNIRRDKWEKEMSMKEIILRDAKMCAYAAGNVKHFKYEALKSDVEYTRDKTVQYIKAKNMILEYLQINDRITSAKIQEMCGFTKQQARSVIDKMRSEDLITLTGKGPAARYVVHK